MNKKGTDKQYVAVFFFFFVRQYISSLSSFVPNFSILSQVVAEKSLTKKKFKFSLERKKNEQIKGLISNMCLLFCYTIQHITNKLCTKFQNPKSSSC